MTLGRGDLLVPARLPASLVANPAPLLWRAWNLHPQAGSEYDSSPIDCQPETAVPPIEFKDSNADEDPAQ